jgi:hypothetical protein
LQRRVQRSQSWKIVAFPIHGFRWREASNTFVVNLDVRTDALGRELVCGLARRISVPPPVAVKPPALWSCAVVAPFAAPGGITSFGKFESTTIIVGDDPAMGTLICSEAAIDESVSGGNADPDRAPPRRSMNCLINSSPESGNAQKPTVRSSSDNMLLKLPSSSCSASCAKRSCSAEPSSARSRGARRSRMSAASTFYCPRGISQPFAAANGRCFRH